MVKTLLFFALNSSWSQSNLALRYMKAMVEDLPYRMSFYEAVVNEPLGQILSEIYAYRPDIIALSAYIWNRTMLKRVVRELIKILPEVSLIIGGPEAFAFEGEPGCTIIIGEGEKVFRDLALVGFQSGQKVIQGSHLPLKEIPFTYRAEDKESLKDHLIYYECYRGCPYSCVYCLSASDKRNDLRFELSKEADRKRLKEELDALVALKPRTLKFIDRSFNIQKDLASFIWRYAIEGDFAFDFHFEIYPDLLTDEDIALLAKACAGRIRFEIGIQSTNSEVLEACGRHSDWQKSRHYLIRLKEETQVRVHADLIAGLPGENFASVVNSLDELCSVQPAAVQLGFLKILPDTPMQAIAKERGYLYLDEPPYQILQSDALSYEELSILDDYAHLLGLYWNKEEHDELWHLLLQKHPASFILESLRLYHTEQSIPLHSVSRQRRHTIITELSQSLI